MKRKKELKKINQKEKRVSRDDNENVVDGNISDTAETKLISEDLAASNEAKHTVEPNEKLNKYEEVSNGVLAVGDPVKEPDTTCVTVNESDKADGIKEDIPEDEALTESDDNIENNNDEVVNENDPEFIGPKLPPRMTEAEIKAFYDELMGKLKFPS